MNSIGRRMVMSVAVGLSLLGMCLVSPARAQVTILNETFEGIFPEGNGWSVGDSNPSGTPAYWNDVSNGHSGYNSSWGGYCAGVGYGGTLSSPTYQNNMTAYMSKTVNLTGYSSAALAFKYKIPSIESGWDKFRIYIDSSVVWEMSAPVTSWQLVQVDLSSFAGGSHTLKFEFTSDSSVVNEGCYLDDILVTAVPIANTARVWDAWWTDEVDADGDGYMRSARLNWDPDVVGSGSLNVFERVYWKLSSSSSWTLFSTVPSHTITGTATSDSQSIGINGGSHNLYDWKIEVYRVGQSTPDYTRDPSNDSDLNDYPMETAAEDPSSAPEIEVRGNGVIIADGDTTPSTGDYTDFVTTTVGATVSRTFWVYNTGTAPLTPGTITVPSGFTLTVGLISSILAGSSDYFTVRLDAASAGTYQGVVSFSNNDADENPFDFTIVGVVGTPQVDLSVSTLTVDGGSAVTGATGATLTVYWEINRTGSGAANNFNHGIYWSANTTISTSDRLLRENGPSTMGTGAAYLGPSAPGQNITVPTDATPGTTYYLGYLADSGNTVAETDEGNNTRYVSVTIAQQTGSLQVTITPSGAISAGAQWQVDGGAWRNSGSTVSGLSVGSHTVAFKTVSG